MDTHDGPPAEPQKSVNPYESPQILVRRRPFLIRLARATRRGVTTYAAEIRRSRLTTVQHLGALGLIFFGLLFICLIAMAFIWPLVNRLMQA